MAAASQRRFPLLEVPAAVSFKPDFAGRLCKFSAPSAEVARFSVQAAKKTSGQAERETKIEPGAAYRPKWKNVEETK